VKVARVLLVPSGRAVLCIRRDAHLFSFAYCRCCRCECGEIEFLASEVERHVENRQFSDAACVFVGVCVFSSLCLKGFADFSSWKYGFVEFLSPASVGGRFFLQFFLGCDETGSLSG
jgi:hypothetical protein